MVDVDTVNDYRDAEHFMEIVDVDLFNTVYDLNLEGTVNGINHALPLRVIRSKGVDVKPDFEIASTDLNTNTVNTKYKNFHNTGDGGITFKVDVIIRKDETWGYGVVSNADYIKKGMKAKANSLKTSWLKTWYINMRPLYVVSDAIDVPNGTYLITSNPKRLQSLDNHTVWTLEFTSFKPLELHTWSVDPSVKTETKTSTSTPTTKSSTSTNQKLKDCKDKMNYSKTEKTSECNKVLQQKLYELGFLRKDQIDGWYGPVTMEAVKKFQKYHNSKGGNLLVDGVAGPVTVNIMATKY